MNDLHRAIVDLDCLRESVIPPVFCGADGLLIPGSHF